MTRGPGSNFYTRHPDNQNVWVKFVTENGLVDDCELRDTTTLPTQEGMFSQGCTLKIKSDGSLYTNTNLDGLAPIWTAELLSITRHVTSAEIKALNSSPIELIPAPGVGKYLVGVSVFRKFNYVTPQYTQPGNTNIVIGSNSVFQFGTFLNGSSSKTFQNLPNNIYELTENTPMSLVNTVGDPSDGNGDMTLIINYQIKNL